MGSISNFLFRIDLAQIVYFIQRFDDFRVLLSSDLRLSLFISSYNWIIIAVENIQRNWICSIPKVRDITNEFKVFIAEQKLILPILLIFKSNLLLNWMIFIVNLGFNHIFIVNLQLFFLDLAVFLAQFSRRWSISYLFFFFYFNVLVLSFVNG